MKYALENSKEFARLEKQSRTSAYDVSTELNSILSFHPRRVLDAGCGSGIVSRFLAGHYPGAAVTGCDFSSERIEQAKKAANDYSNLEFSVEDLKNLSFKKEEFDLIVCRYVMQHQDTDSLCAILSGIYRTLAFKGTLCAVDIDGGFHNLHPMPALVAETLDLLDRSKRVDLRVGRKLPSLMVEAGFTHVTCEIQTLLFEPNTPAMQEESGLIEERLSGAIELFSQLLGSKSRAIQFRDEYLEALEKEGTILFFNKFIVLGSKPRSKQLVQVK